MQIVCHVEETNGMMETNAGNSFWINMLHIKCRRDSGTRQPTRKAAKNR
jgi:hypothetical protein